MKMEEIALPIAVEELLLSCPTAFTVAICRLSRGDGLDIVEQDQDGLRAAQIGHLLHLSQHCGLACGKVFKEGPDSRQPVATP